MMCPKCSNQFDIYNAVIAEGKENEGRWICPECKVPLNDSDVTTKLDALLADSATVCKVPLEVVQTIEEKVKQAIEGTIGKDRPFMDVPDIAEEITQNVMGIIGQNTQGACEYCGKPKNSPNYAYHICASVKKEVVMTVLGGVVDGVAIPPGIVVKVRDYDVEGCDEDKLMQDKEGNRYIEAVFTEDDMSYIGDYDDGDPDGDPH